MKISYTTRGAGIVLVIFGICFLPWFIMQQKFNSKVLTDTYLQNIRMEKKMDSLADSILRNQKTILDYLHK